MTEPGASSPQPSRLRANRKIVGQPCGSCAQGFDLAEEICRCAVCGGYHHVACWEKDPICRAAAGDRPAALPSKPGTERADASTKVDQPKAEGEAKRAHKLRRCPMCKERIIMDAVKCRYCGTVFDRQFDVVADRTGIAKTINKNANVALALSLLGVVCWFILLPIAIVKAKNTLSMIDEQPDGFFYGSARKKATAAVIIAGILLVLTGFNFLRTLMTTMG